MCAMRSVVTLLWIALVLAGDALGRLGPENLLVVVNSRNQDSLEVGLRYVEKRGIPEKNVVRLFYGSRKYRVKWDDFKENVFDPVMEHIKKNNLQRKINMIALTKGIPYDVEGEAATWMFYAHGVCMRKRNPYFGSDQPLNARLHFGPDRYPAVMLTGFTRQDALKMIDNGIASDGTHPSGTVYFMRGGRVRGLRYKQVPPVAAELELMGIRSELLPGTSIEDKPDVLGYLTGSTWVKTRNTYLPGAFAEHLTSFAGKIHHKERGQMSILWFIYAGATGSCGTVDEPLANWRKFPHARFYVTYARGFTLGETMWQSVSVPYQVIFVGEPLACPFRRDEPSVELVSAKPTAGEELRIEVRATAGDAGHRLESILVSVDDALPRPVFPLPASDTRVLLAFPTSVRRSPETEMRVLKETIFETVLKKDEPPAAAFKRLADQISGTTGFPIKVKADGNVLKMVYLPNSVVSAYFRCRCEGVARGAPAWLPAEPVCRFRGHSQPRRAMASFRFTGKVRRAFEAGMTIDGVERRVSMELGKSGSDVFRALADAFGDVERFAGPQGIDFQVSETSAGQAAILVRAKEPGPKWNGCELRLGIPRNVGLKVIPYERKLKLLGGGGASPGAYVLALTQNPLPAEKEIVLAIGKNRFRFGSRGNESTAELVNRFCNELRAAAPEVTPQFGSKRIVLRSEADDPPSMKVEKQFSDFSLDILGGRWAKLRSFPPEKGKKPRPPKHKWIAFLNLHVGRRSIERTVAFDISPLKVGRHDITVYTVFGGLYRGVASAKGSFVKEQKAVKN